MKLTEEVSVTMAEMLAANGADPELVGRVRRGEPVLCAQVKEATGMTGPELAAAFAWTHFIRTGQSLNLRGEALH